MMRPSSHSLAKIYVETTDAEWRARFLLLAMKRKDFLETEKDLSCEELVRELEDGLLEAFTYFLGLTFEQQQLCAQQFNNSATTTASGRNG